MTAIVLFCWRAQKIAQLQSLWAHSFNQTLSLQCIYETSRPVQLVLKHSPWSTGLSNFGKTQIGICFKCMVTTHRQGFQTHWGSPKCCCQVLYQGLPTYFKLSGMVSDLGWDSLRIRRLLHDVTIFFKIQHDFVRIPFPPQVTPAPLQSTRSSHTFKKQVTYASIAAYKHSFFIRTIPVWNGLPGSAIVAPSVGMFQAAALPTLRAM